MKSFTSLSDARFESLFRDFQSSAFRLETLQRYAVEYEEIPFRDFLAGRPRYTHPTQAAWAELIKTNIAAGKTMSRVHVVVEPLSDYVRFELLWPYVDSVAAGEDVRILPAVKGAWPTSVPQEDFWLFDSQLAAVMHYDDVGHFVSAEMTEDPEEIAQFIRWRDTAVAGSVPYRDYLGTINLKAD